MSAISAKIIKKPIYPKKCETYGKQMPLYRPRVRLYGSADLYNDPPYTIYICMDCASAPWQHDRKIKDVVKEYNQSV